MATYVYKYVHPKYEWLYVGKADNTVKERVDAHSREGKFQPYLDETKIFFIKLDNKAQSKFIETYLIDKYKPHLNRVDKYEGESSFSMELPKWEPYTGNTKWKTGQRSLMKNSWENTSNNNMPDIDSFKNKIKQQESEISRLRCSLKNIENAWKTILESEKKSVEFWKRQTEFHMDQNRFHYQIRQKDQENHERAIYILKLEQEILNKKYEKLKKENETIMYKLTNTLSERKKMQREIYRLRIGSNFLFNEYKNETDTQYDGDAFMRNRWLDNLKRIFKGNGIKNVIEI